MMAGLCPLAAVDLCSKVYSERATSRQARSRPWALAALLQMGLGGPEALGDPTVLLALTVCAQSRHVAAGFTAL